MKAVGESSVRPDAYEKVMAKSLYPDDIEFDNMLYAGVKRSTIPYGRVLNINIPEIKNLPGVVDVISYSDLPGADKHGVVFKDIPILVKDIVKRVGDCILLIIAENKASLNYALNKTKIEYEEFPGIFTVEDALKDDAPILGEKSNILYDLKIKRGNVEDSFKSSRFIAVNEYETQMTEHAFLQPECAVAKMNSDGSMDVYVATQYPHYDREEVARALNLKEDDVRIHNTAIGGAFGGREDINPQCHAAIASFITGKPVKVLYSREESTISHSKRHPIKMYYKTAADETGKLCALKARIYGDTGAYASWGMNVLRKAAVHATGPYVIPNVDIRAIAVYTNNPYAGAMRGFGAAQVPFAMESQMDILAEKLGIHPLKFRYMNSFDIGSVTSTGQVLSSSVAIKKCIEKLASIDNVYI